MRQFDVLSRSQDLKSSYLLEASAGTGKTHSIENIVVRLLLEGEDFTSLENILVVTFTRAATDDLRLRIRNNLSKVITLFKRRLQDDELVYNQSPDYLKAIFEEEYSLIEKKLKCLEIALTFFDKAQIFTIHGFCHRMLKEFLFEGDFCGKSDTILASEVYSLIRDFFRSTVNTDLICQEQLKRVLSVYKGIEGLEKKLYKYVQGGVEIKESQSLLEQLTAFQGALKELKSSIDVDPSLLLEDFYTLAPVHKEICDVKKRPKPENVEKIERFIDVLKKESWNIDDYNMLIKEGIYWLDVIHSGNRDKRKKLPDDSELHCPHFCDLLKNTIAPVIEGGRSVEATLLRLAFHCRKMVKGHLKQQEIISFDDLLNSMQAALSNDGFVKQVQKRYNVAIIDEFQDTDPVQWEIFDKLFNGSSRLFLVGDPKQSIYGFRQADIYTYLQASFALGGNSRASLDTNFRSTTPLVAALNFLFDEKTIPGLMILPKNEQVISYRPVNSSGLVVEKPFNDGRSAVNFFGVDIFADEKKSLGTLEEEYFFPFIADEILRMYESGHFKFSECAILVSDRYQSERIAEFLNRYGIPSVAQRSCSLVEKPAFEAFRNVLKGILKPRNESALKVALTGPIFAWTEKELYTLKENELRADVIAEFSVLKKLWEDVGFAAFFQALLVCRAHKERKLTIIEEILIRKGGGEFYRTLEQLAMLFVEEERRYQSPPYHLLSYFDELKKKDQDDEGITKCLSDPSQDAVSIVTIHSSKGLEFDVVFAVGLIKSSKKIEPIVPVFQEGKKPLLEFVTTSSDKKYIDHCREIDAEKMRQLYVAWTRAKQRLYSPVIFEENSFLKAGESSPMALYVKLLQEGLSATNVNSCREFSDFLKEANHSDKISIFPLREMPLIIHGMNSAESTPLEIPFEPKICIKKEFLHSFTSLSTHTLEKDKSAAFINFEGGAPHDFLATDKSKHSLPAGAATGNLLHLLFEKIPFSIVRGGRQNTHLKSYVGKFIANTPFEGWEEVFCDVIYDALTAVIPLGASGFSLQNVESEKCYREHEFLYTAENIAHIGVTSGFVKGFIDLIFESGGKYYILDWKSNWLGPSSKEYQQESLNSAMEAYGYYLQAALYKEALKRYLALCNLGSFDEIFGGVIYMFLRGVCSETSEGVICP